MSKDQTTLVCRLRECATQCDQPTSDLYTLAAAEIERLRNTLADALASFRLQGPDDHPLQAIGRASVIMMEALHG